MAKNGTEKLSKFDKQLKFRKHYFCQKKRGLYNLPLKRTLRNSSFKPNNQYENNYPKKYLTCTPGENSFNNHH